MFAARFLKEHRAPFCDIVNGHVISIYPSFTLYTISILCMCLFDFCSIVRYMCWKHFIEGYRIRFMLETKNISNVPLSMYHSLVLLFICIIVFCVTIVCIQCNNEQQRKYFLCIVSVLQFKWKIRPFSLNSHRGSSYNGPSLMYLLKNVI